LFSESRQTKALRGGALPVLADTGLGDSGTLFTLTR